MKLLTLSALLLSTTILTVRADYEFTLVGDIIREKNKTPKAKINIYDQGRLVADPTLDLHEVRTTSYIGQIPTALKKYKDFKTTDNFGTAQEEVQLTFTYQGIAFSPVFTLPKNYPLMGEWIYTHQDNEVVPTLLLRVKLGNKSSFSPLLEKRTFDSIPYKLDKTKPITEIPGRYRFTGEGAYRETITEVMLEDPIIGKKHRVSLTSPNGVIPDHEGREIIYVEPFGSDGELEGTKDDYIGTYTLAGKTLTPTEMLANREDGQIVYSDGSGNIYAPQMTQQKWQVGQLEVGFFLASYREEDKLKYTKGSKFLGNGFSRGLYQLYSIKDTGKSRRELWRQLGDTTQEVIINSPLGISSIPGMGRVVAHHVSKDESGADVAKLHAAIEDITEVTQKNLETQNAQDSVVILGPTGSGKSTLLHFLAGVPLIADESTGELRLVPIQTLDGLNVGHTTAVGTKLPGVWVNGRLAFWDLPGFGDPRGTEGEIPVSYANQQVLSSGRNTKLVLTVPESFLKISNERGKAFLRLLNELTELFTDDHELHKGLSVVITNHDKLKLDAVFNTFKQDSDTVKSPILSTRGKTLLEFLVKNFKSRVSSFPAPIDTEEYAGDPDHIMEMIAQTTYVKPKTRITVSDSVKVKVSDLAVGLNKYMASFLKTEGTRHIQNYCRIMIDNFVGKIADLRSKFEGLIRTLQSLTGKKKPEEFATVLEPIMGRDVVSGTIRSTMGQIGFLQEIGKNVNYDIVGWAEALNGVIAQIQKLTKAHKGIFKDGILNLKGLLLGTSDIVKALDEHKKETIKSIRGFASNTLIIDENITASGSNLILISPQWSVNGKKMISLKGKNGAPYAAAAAEGVDGLPGNFGESGGHFYGKGLIFKGLDQLTIDTSGGNGGNGQAGGNGAKGTDGVDAHGTDVHTVTKHVTGIGEGPGNHHYFMIGSTVNDPNPKRITKVELKAAARVDRIEFFSGNHHSIGAAGGNGGTPQTLILNAGEILTGTITRSGKEVDSMGLITTQRPYWGRFGGNGGDNFDTVITENGKEIVGLEGRHNGSVITKIDAVYFDHITKSIPATDGTAGQKGGRGGAGGKGGLSGSAFIDAATDPNTTFTAVSANGANGGNGVAGIGGQGGSHGRPYFGYHGHVASASAPTTPGVTPAATDLNTEGQKDTSQVAPVDKTARRKDYVRYYLEEAEKPESSPFIRIFPGMESRS